MCSAGKKSAGARQTAVGNNRCGMHFNKIAEAVDEEFIKVMRKYPVSPWELRNAYGLVLTGRKERRKVDRIQYLRVPSESE